MVESECSVAHSVSITSQTFTRFVDLFKCVYTHRSEWVSHSLHQLTRAQAVMNEGKDTYSQMQTLAQVSGEMWGGVIWIRVEVWCMMDL